MCHVTLQLRPLLSMIPLLPRVKMFLLELSYTIRHNGSQGITSVTADLVVGQIDNDVTSLQQSLFLYDLHLMVTLVLQ